MPEQPSQRASLSQISHLFLSSVRQKQTGSASPPPRRRPPAPKRSVELTAAELEQVMGPEVADKPPPLPPVTAIIASHLGARQLECARLYARQVAAGGKRVGLIAVGAAELRMFRFDPNPATEPAAAIERSYFDARAITDAINELSCELDCWLVLAENPRQTESRALLRRIDRWVALCGTEHEQIVACYRTFKGLSDLHASGPSLRLAILEPRSATEADAVYHRLSGVCRQFLNWQVEGAGPVMQCPLVSESPVIWCEVSHDKAQLADQGHWQVVAELIERARPSLPIELPPAPQPQPAAEPVPVAVEAAQEVTMAMSKPIAQPADGPGMAEVIDVPDAEEGLIPLLIQHWNGELVETPVRAPMCPEARLTVSRERRLVLVATARSELSELKVVAEAYRWVAENRALLGMALPQFALDAHQLPHLRLIVDQAELNPEVLRTMLSAETVTIHTYRRVKWGPRVGLLLNAA